MEIHSTLNQKLFSGEKLKPEIKDRILKIVDAFVSDLTIKPDVIDIQLVGSNVSYNYTPNSDLDVHIVTNFELLACDENLVQALYNAEKTNFNKNHDIKIKGINVELYVEDVKAGTASNGVYSVLEDDWVKFPKKLTGIKEYDLSREVGIWKDKIEDALSSGTEQEVKDIINRLYMIRKNSILIDGEYGKGNQLFKEIRNLGLLDELKEKVHELLSRELSLESIAENYTFGQMLNIDF